jgi:hypothetical protein
MEIIQFIEKECCVRIWTGFRRLMVGPRGVFLLTP